MDGALIAAMSALGTAGSALGSALGQRFNAKRMRLVIDNAIRVHLESTVLRGVIEGAIDVAIIGLNRRLSALEEVVYGRLRKESRYGDTEVAATSVESAKG